MISNIFHVRFVIAIVYYGASRGSMPVSRKMSIRGNIAPKDYLRRMNHLAQVPRCSLPSMSSGRQSIILKDPFLSAAAFLMVDSLPCNKSTSSSYALRCQCP
ncbi:uncharacterized protein LOC127751839 isoform X1 [Frankliniella occidentalis]|uniref:Uncharacterized protein LOC127751839 isoform X1 n=1 Tax=Frankliniella occidentalis TaxID=133901 RepID=A0A9C6X9X8_FRAOC|nr:uncharacterized protein LOC127751839 isoform X1 [Frankliniella occidentalis]